MCATNIFSDFLFSLYVIVDKLQQSAILYHDGKSVIVSFILFAPGLSWQCLSAFPPLAPLSLNQHSKYPVIDYMTTQQFAQTEIKDCSRFQDIATKGINETPLMSVSGC